MADLATPLTEDALRQLFLDARSQNTWRDDPVDVGTLKRLWDLTRMGPTSANCSPARIVFVQSAEAKKRLEPCLAEGNRPKAMTAPVTAIIGQDMRFYEQLPKLFPHADAKSWFEGNDAMIEDTAFRNATLQGAYLIMAARALGLDCGPMSGFDKAKVDETFFASTNIRSNFLCNIGYGDPKGLFGRSPRFEFDDVCSVV